MAAVNQVNAEEMLLTDGGRAVWSCGAAKRFMTAGVRAAAVQRRARLR